MECSECIEHCISNIGVVDRLVTVVLQVGDVEGQEELTLFHDVSHCDSASALFRLDLWDIRQSLHWYRIVVVAKGDHGWC